MRYLIAVLTVALVLWAPEKLPAQGKDATLAENIQDLQLTADEEGKIADILTEHRSRTQKAARELATLVKAQVGKVRDVLTPGQKKKLEAMKEQRKQGRSERLGEQLAHLHELDLTDAERASIATIRKEYHPKVVKAMEGLKGILTAEQRTAREEGLKADKKRREVIASLKLTDEQKQKVEAVGKEVRSLVHEELEKIRDVLTESQKQKLQDFKEERGEHVRDRMAHRIANHKDLDLTEEQKSTITKIREEYGPKIHEASNKVRANMREGVDKILSVLKR